MSLLEELKEKLQTVCAEQDEQLAKIRVHEAFLGAAMQDIRDLSRAIAALEPSAVEGSSVAAYFDARRAEALLDHQPEAASPEFASEQSVPVQIVHEERWPYSVSYTIAESGFGSGAYEHLYEARDDYEAFKLEPKYLTVVLKHRGKVIDTFARPIGADVPEDERDETWVPPPGYTYIPTQGERCVCVNLMQDGIGNFFCCNQRGETSADAERTSDESQAEDPTIDAITAHIENQPGVSSQASSTEVAEEGAASHRFWGSHPDGTFTPMPSDWKPGDGIVSESLKIIESIRVAPEGFTPWTPTYWSGITAHPFPEGVSHFTPVEVILVGHKHETGTAGSFHWAKRYDFERDLEIIAYKRGNTSFSTKSIGEFARDVGAALTESERTEVASEPLATTEQTLITDDIPSIPREEIPIGAAVETYTDSGIETVKISGTTYVVDDEPERQAETQPEAAYAPVNEDEGLMWSNGFEADAKSKAETEQDKRPFWTRAPKPKVNA